MALTGRAQFLVLTRPAFRFALCYGGTQAEEVPVKHAFLKEDEREQEGNGFC